MRWGNAWTEAEVKAHLARFKGKDNPQLPATDSESGSGDGLQKTIQLEKATQRYDLRIHQKRRRLTDPDGVHYKSCIDGLVKGEILRDDSAAVIRSISFTQEKCGRGEPEETIIDIWQIDE